MKARFTSEDTTEDRVCTVFGHSFPIGEWVSVPADVYARLAKNPMFEVDANEDGQADPSLEGLRASLDALGVKYHHKAGPEKLAALLAEAQKADAE